MSLTKKPGYPGNNGIDHIHTYAEKIKDPAARDVYVLTEETALSLSANVRLSVAEIYIKAMEEGIWPARYVRNHASITLEEQLILSKKAVVIAGAGGLGGHIITQLARLGVGFLTIFDPDRFDETNLNRQVLSNIKTLDEPKSETASTVIREINPAVTCSAQNVPISESVLLPALEKGDVAVDALDSIPDRFLFEKFCKKMAVPFVHGAIAGFEGQVMTIFPEDKGLSQIYGESSFASSAESPEALLGNPAPAPSLIATFQVMEVIKILLNKGDILRNTLLHANLLSGHFHKFKFGQCLS